MVRAHVWGRQPHAQVGRGPRVFPRRRRPVVHGFGAVDESGASRRVCHRDGRSIVVSRGGSARGRRADRAVSRRRV